VVDVTHPSFALPVGRPEAIDRIERYAQAERRRGRLRQWARRRFYGYFLKRSVLGRALMGAAGTFLPGMPTYLVTPAIAQFRREHPSVTVELRSDVQASRNIEGHDITLLTDHVPLRSDAVVRRLVDSHSVLCASPDYVRRHGAPGAPQELPQHAFVRFVPPEEPPRPLDLVDESDPSRHQRMLSPWICERSTLVATYASRRHMPVRTRAFLDHLLAHAQQAMAEIEPSPVAP